MRQVYLRDCVVQHIKTRFADWLTRSACQMIVVKPTPKKAFWQFLSNNGSRTLRRCSLGMRKAVDRLKTCKLPILYIEDDGGRYSDLAVFSEVCPQLVVGKVVGSGHFPTMEVPDQVNAMIQRFIAVYVKL